MNGNIRWVLVDGASETLSKAHERAAEAVGRMLGRGGYGLIVGRWSGVHFLVTRSFRDVVGQECFSRLRQIDTTGGSSRKPEKIGQQLDPSDPDGGDEYSEEA